MAALLWIGGLAGPLSYSVSRNADPVVGIAVDMMSSDLEMVLGSRPEKGGAAVSDIRIIKLDRQSVNLSSLGVPRTVADSLRSLNEAFWLGVHKGQLVVVGSDKRGTAYGVLEVSRLAGVSPWVWWGDAVPERREALEIPDSYSTFQHPSVEYRGFFLNDEDWAFRAWSTQTFSPQDNPETISADTYREMFKLLLRLRGNTLWPGMHPGTTPFFKVPGARQAADSCAIFIGTSHCEPLLRNNVGEWDVKTRGRYNYITNKDAVLDYWTERLLEMKDSPALYTIGMRGIHDGSMEGVRTLEEKTEALQKVIWDQRELLSKYVNPKVEKVPQMFMPYKEVLQIMENGLELPDDVTIVWCDDNYGYMTRLPDSVQQKRSGGHGVYYHLSYCGRPHDHLWLSTMQPGLVYEQMRLAYDNNVRKVWIANVHDPKVAAYDLELFLDMAWDIDCVEPQSVDAHLASWLEREYGREASELLTPALKEFYRLCSIRKPEFMGWSQVEVADKEHYPGGLTPVRNTEFSFSEFGNEAQRYIDSYRSIALAVQEAGKTIRPELNDAYFAAVEYPVLAAGSMAEKMLYAQRARQRALTTYAPGVWKADSTMMAASALSSLAYQKIRSLTDYYNFTMSSGKWKGAMSDVPRHLYVFWDPMLPVALKEQEIEQWGALGVDWHSDSVKESGKDYYASNACRFDSSKGEMKVVQSLGHSGAAVSVERGGELEYRFSSAPMKGKAVLRVALIPTQAIDTGDIRFKATLDGQEQVFSLKEPYRSETWKENVSRAQARFEMEVENLGEGEHILRLEALDGNIIFDQWMLDCKVGRKFYVFPLAPER